MSYEIKNVWSVLLRLFHWSLVLSIITLVVTGLYVNTPWTNTTLEGSVAFPMASIRYLHFLAGYLFTAAIIVRLFLYIFGNRQERIWDVLPVDNIGKGDLEIFNKPVFPQGEQQGYGIHEAPRGTLSHWIVIRDGKIKNYQCVVPSTWNAGPRDSEGVAGPYEASLVGNPVADAEKPLELLRTVHSFDPCIACAIHTVNQNGQEITKVKAL